MKKSMKIEKIIEILFILFFIISLLINLVIHTHLADPCINLPEECNFTNDIISAFWFIVFFWIHNVGLWILSIWYFILALRSKNDIVIKIVISFIAILTSGIIETLLINFILNL